MLLKVRNFEMNPKVAKAIRLADTLLGQVCTEAEIDAAAAGFKPSRGRGAGITLSVEID